jgi:hypothetical protein
MKAHPRTGQRYRQEFRRKHAEDEAKVVRIGASLDRYTDVVVTQEFTPLEPGNVEEKYYARGVGMVKAVAVKGEREELHLVSVNKG